jgi:hypothetical protein
MPLGFFLSVSLEITQPTRLIWLVYAGAVSLAAGGLSLGVGLIRAATGTWHPSSVVAG